jgi:hypothetical protein
VAKVKHRQLDRLRAKSYKGSTSEWEHVLRRTLLRTPVQGDGVQALEGLDIVSTLTGDPETGSSELTIVWRRSKRGTTVRLFPSVETTLDFLLTVL